MNPQHTHTHIKIYITHIYIYIYVCVCVCVYSIGNVTQFQQSHIEITDANFSSFSSSNNMYPFFHTYMRVCLYVCMYVCHACVCAFSLSLFVALCRQHTSDHAISMSVYAHTYPVFETYIQTYPLYVCISVSLYVDVAVYVCICMLLSARSLSVPTMEQEIYSLLCLNPMGMDPFLLCCALAGICIYQVIYIYIYIYMDVHWYQKYIYGYKYICVCLCMCVWNNLT